jgi:hypothetical protein
VNDPDSTWRGWLILGAGVLLVAVLAAFIFLPEGNPAPTAAVLPSPTLADEHAVPTDEGVVSFRLEGDALVVRLETASGTSELGRATLPYMTAASPSGTPGPTGSAMFVLVCGAPDSPGARRYVFGHIDSSHGEYVGPEAVGHVATDGLFLFAILPDAAAGPISIKSKSGGGGFPADIFSTIAEGGTVQPSGCVVLA